MSKNWTLWYDARPTDTNLVYRWRVSRRKILGLYLRPEWSAKLVLCGMGEYWPSGSNWNGSTRTVDKSLEWRVATDDEPEGSEFWDLGLLPSPFTGKLPKVTAKTQWIGAMPYNAEYLNIQSWLVDSSGWRDANELIKTWNTRYITSEEKI